jgi:hypothetical protein
MLGRSAPSLPEAPTGAKHSPRTRQSESLGRKLRLHDNARYVKLTAAAPSGAMSPSTSGHPSPPPTFERNGKTVTRVKRDRADSVTIPPHPHGDQAAAPRVVRRLSTPSPHADETAVEMWKTGLFANCGLFPPEGSCTPRRLALESQLRRARSAGRTNPSQAAQRESRVSAGPEDESATGSAHSFWTAAIRDGVRLESDTRRCAG